MFPNKRRKIKEINIEVCESLQEAVNLLLGNSITSCGNGLNVSPQASNNKVKSSIPKLFRQMILDRLNHLSENKLEELFRRYFTKTVTISKFHMVQSIAEKYFDQESVFEKRTKEKDNLLSLGSDSEFMNQVNFVRMSNKLVSSDIIKEFLSFLPRTSTELFNVGATCRSFYIHLLSTWHTTLVNRSNLYQISLLVLRNTRNIIFSIKLMKRSKKFEQVDLDYLLDNLNPNTVRSVEFKTLTSKNLCSFFLDFLKRHPNDYPFRNVHSLNCHHGPIGRGPKLLAEVFPSLRVVKFPSCIRMLEGVETLESLHMIFHDHFKIGIDFHNTAADFDFLNGSMSLINPTLQTLRFDFEIRQALRKVGFNTKMTTKLLTNEIRRHFPTLQKLHFENLHPKDTNNLLKHFSFSVGAEQGGEANDTNSSQLKSLIIHEQYPSSYCDWDGSLNNKILNPVKFSTDFNTIKIDELQLHTIRRQYLTHTPKLQTLFSEYFPFCTKFVGRFELGMSTLGDGDMLKSITDFMFYPDSNLVDQFQHFDLCVRSRKPKTKGNIEFLRFKFEKRSRRFIITYFLVPNENSLSLIFTNWNKKRIGSFFEEGIVNIIPDISDRKFKKFKDAVHLMILGSNDHPELFRKQDVGNGSFKSSGESWKRKVPIKEEFVDDLRVSADERMEVQESCFVMFVNNTSQEN